MTLLVGGTHAAFSGFAEQDLSGSGETIILESTGAIIAGTGSDIVSETGSTLEDTEVPQTETYMPKKMMYSPGYVAQLKRHARLLERYGEAAAAAEINAEIDAIDKANKPGMEYQDYRAQHDKMTKLEETETHE